MIGARSNSTQQRCRTADPKVMTAPRQIIPGTTYLLTRRATQQQFLLRPDESVTQVITYCLAEAATRFDVCVHGWVAMSNHIHLVVTDTKGRLPEFMERFYKLTAKALNAYWRRRENLWSSEQASVVRLVGRGARLESLIYVLMNPVSAFLFDKAREWPGASSYRQNLSEGAVTVERPTIFFSRRNRTMPARVELKISRLPGWEELAHTRWRALVYDAVRAAELRARRRRMRDKITLVGAAGVLAAKPSRRPRGSKKRRVALRPNVACAEPKLLAAALTELVDFRKAYRTALDRWRQGDRQVAFPLGTVHMVRFHGAHCVHEPCTPPPSPPPRGRPQHDRPASTKLAA